MGPASERAEDPRAGLDPRAGPEELPLLRQLLLCIPDLLPSHREIRPHADGPPMSPGHRRESRSPENPVLSEGEGPTGEGKRTAWREKAVVAGGRGGHLPLSGDSGWHLPLS